MKAALYVAALVLSASASAQVPDPNAPPEGVTQQGTVPDGAATPPPGTNQPPAVVPAGTPLPDQQAAFAPQPAATNYPPCSRSITDRCIQTYERGVRR
jgi:hypothetical protein